MTSNVVKKTDGKRRLIERMTSPGVTIAQDSAVGGPFQPADCSDLDSERVAPEPDFGLFMDLAWEEGVRFVKKSV
ncbi:hypothetical protein [Rhodopirellula sallentina]|uniref:hypothetical protein n=1 Tax=Rhodopirellula sallentina TaxID=1263869 RepID=UPI001F39407A|nr:hypothetical protein [Rhodopirellula sallentina]